MARLPCLMMSLAISQLCAAKLNVAPLYASLQCRKYSCADFGGQHNVAFKRSTDGGVSFSPMQTLLDPMAMFTPEQCPVDAASVRSQNKSCVFWDPVCAATVQLYHWSMQLLSSSETAPVCSLSPGRVCMP